MSAPKFDLGAILNMSGFAEAAAALYVAGAATEVPAAMRAQLDLVVNNRASELQKAIDAAVSDITARAGSFLNDPNIQQAINSLLSSASQSDLMSRIANAQRDLDRAQDRAQDVNDVETPEQHISRLWAQIDELTRKIDDVLDDVVTPEERARREAAAERLANARENHRLAVESRDPVRITAAGAELSAAGENVTKVDRDITTAAIGDKRLSPETGNNTLTSIDDRGAAYSQVAAVGDRVEVAAGFNASPANGPVNSNNRSAAPVAYNDDDMQDIDVRVVSVAPESRNSAVASNVPVPNPTPASSGQPRFETAEVALGETGQFTPASASQPGVTTGGRAV